VQVLLDDFQSNDMVHQHPAMGMDWVSEAQITIVIIGREYPILAGSEHLAMALPMRRAAGSNDASFVGGCWYNRFVIALSQAYN
jgi:hypothetical protein